MEKKKREKLAAMGLTLEEFEEMKERQKEEERAMRREAKRNVTMSENYKCVRYGSLRLRVGSVVRGTDRCPHSSDLTDETKRTPHTKLI